MSVLPSFDQGRGKSAPNNMVSSNGVNYRNRQCNIKSTRKNACWDCSNESHFRSDARCPKYKEPTSNTGSADDKSSSNKKSSTDDKTFCKSDKTPTVTFDMVNFRYDCDHLDNGPCPLVDDVFLTVVLAYKSYTHSQILKFLAGIAVSTLNLTHFGMLSIGNTVSARTPVPNDVF